MKLEKNLNIDGALGHSSQHEDREPYYLVFDENQKSWCFMNMAQRPVYCRDTSLGGFDNANAYSSNLKFPPSGQWSLIDTNDGHRVTTIDVDCPSNENHFNSNEPEFLKVYPATTFLFILNTGIAFLYWDKRIDPSSVCKQYSKIVSGEMELWRSFTGALAHFELLHLGFNMMTLQALGSVLEPMYGSITFLFYNICLIPLTTILMLILIKIQIIQSGNEAHAQTSTVGFSGVLFAWVVVLSLERNTVCPLSFAQGLCFDTYRVMNLKFNLAPFVQLLVTHFIMPRASFIGHLSGIICGYMLHWNILPIEVFWSPNVLIPAILFLHWWFVRRIIPVRYGVMSSSSSVHHNSTSTSSERSSTRRSKLLSMTRKAMALSSIISFLLLDMFDSMALSQVLGFIMYGFSIKYYDILASSQGAGNGNSNGDSNGDNNGSLSSLQQHQEQVLLLKNKSKILWKGTILTLLLILGTDAMTIPVWICTKNYIESERQIYFSFWAVVVPAMILRWIIHLICFVLACNTLLHHCHDVDVGEGEQDNDNMNVFTQVFGFIMRWGSDGCMILFPSIISSSSSFLPNAHETTAFIPFEGNGQTLVGDQYSQELTQRGTGVSKLVPGNSRRSVEGDV